eukprot:SM000062S19930  [mRNA]  locus=s62:403407:409422:- [translate_table: standard]
MDDGGALLREENARLHAEMAAMKKRIMAAMRKQQAELRAKDEALAAARGHAVAAAAPAAPEARLQGTPEATTSSPATPPQGAEAGSGGQPHAADQERDALQQQLADAVEQVSQARQREAVALDELQEVRAQAKDRTLALEQQLHRLLEELEAANRLAEETMQHAPEGTQSERDKEELSRRHHEECARLQADAADLREDLASAEELKHAQTLASSELLRERDDLRSSLQAAQNTHEIYTEDLKAEIRRLQALADEAATTSSKGDLIAEQAQRQEEELRVGREQALRAEALTAEVERLQKELQQHMLEEARLQKEGEHARLVQTELENKLQALQASTEKLADESIEARATEAQSGEDPAGPKVIAHSKEAMLPVGHENGAVLPREAEAYRHMEEMDKLRSMLREEEDKSTRLREEVEQARKECAGLQASKGAMAAHAGAELTEARAVRAAAEQRADKLAAELHECEFLLQASAAAFSEQLGCQEVLRARSQAPHRGRLLVAVQAKLHEENVKSAEAEAKLGRLQKRAKQRIQEVTKEKEEVEVQLGAACKRVTEVVSQQAALQDELERSKARAAEALRLLEQEKEQLRQAQRGWKEEVRELRSSLEAKDLTLNESRRLAAAKEQTLLEMTTLAEEAQAREDQAVAGLTESLQKVREELDEANTEAEKSVKTIAELQAALGEREQRLAEVEAEASGDAARYKSAFEEARGELCRNHERDKEAWLAEKAELRTQLEATEGLLQETQSAATEKQGTLEKHLNNLQQELVAVQADLEAARSEGVRVTAELVAYKKRAHALLQKKNAELDAARDADHVLAAQQALQDAKREAAEALSERDRAVSTLRKAAVEYETQLASRELALTAAEQRIAEMAARQEVLRSQFGSQQQEWQELMDSMQAEARAQLEALEDELKLKLEIKLGAELAEMRLQYEKLQGEYREYQETAVKMLEGKDTHIAELMSEMARLQQEVAIHSASKMHNGRIERPDRGKTKKMEPQAAFEAEQQILVLARQQAQREEEVAQGRRHVQALQEEIAELERENRLRAQQEAMIKEELRNMDRAQKREGVDMTYLKNVILKLLQTGEVEALLPVVAMLLQFSPEELRRCVDSYRALPSVPEVPLSGAAAVIDAAATAPRSLLSRLASLS